MGALRIVFLGSDAIALPLLDSLATNPAVELAGVFTQPDRATGRGQKVQANAIKEWALARALPAEDAAMRSNLGRVLDGALQAAARAGRPLPPPAPRGTHR